MKTFYSFLIVAVCCILLGSCHGSRVNTVTTKIKYIKIPQEVNDNRSDRPNSSLQRFISDENNKGASVVVRDSNVDRDGVSKDPAQSRVCSLIERELMDLGYNPRDRKLFENAVAKLANGSDYPAIRKATGTDLIFEVTYNIDDYIVSNYYSASYSVSYSVSLGMNTLDMPNRLGMSNIPENFIWQKTVPMQYKNKIRYITEKIPMQYTVKGFNIEIKVILLADNLIAGVYKYYYTPCSSESGCQVVSYNENGLSYISSNKTYEASPSSRVETRVDKFDKETGDFIRNVVIPSMFAEMKGEPPVQDYQMNRNVNETSNNRNTQTLERPQSINNNKNSNEMANSISDLIQKISTSERGATGNQNLRNTDEKRFSRLNRKNLQKDEISQIENFITSNTSYTTSPGRTENDKIVIYCTNKNIQMQPVGYALLFFIDEQCVGVGTSGKGAYMSLPKDKYGEGIHTLTIWSCAGQMFSSPVDFSIKNYFSFELNIRSIRLTN